MPNVNEIAKQTLVALKERKLKPTPENYSEIFEELSEKCGFITNSKIQLKKYRSLLLPVYQQELDSKSLRTVEQLISFLISALNRKNSRQGDDFFELLFVISKVLQVSRDKKVRELAKITSGRILKTMDTESVYILSKKWKDFEKNYEDSDLDKAIRKHGLNKYDDFDSIIKKLLAKLDERSYDYISGLILLCLNPSLVKDLKVEAFIHGLTQKPFIITEPDFKNKLLECVSRRVAVDNMYVQKNLIFFNEHLRKILDLLVLLDKSNQSNMEFIHSLKPNEKGEITLSFEDLKLRFTQLDEKISTLNAAIKFMQNLEERETWSVVKEFEKLDENYTRYKVNYSLALFSISNYRFIMEKYGVSSLNEIFVRFKKILKESCSEFDELWMIDEKSYLIVAPGKSKEDIEGIIQRNLEIIENFRFIYKQDLITPKISVFYLDKQSKPNLNIYEELLEKISQNDQSE